MGIWWQIKKKYSIGHKEMLIDSVKKTETDQNDGWLELNEVLYSRYKQITHYVVLSIWAIYR